MHERFKIEYGALFVRAFHSKEQWGRVLRDDAAVAMIGEASYRENCLSLILSIDKLHADFSGTMEDALRWVVNHGLEGLSLPQTVFAERALETAVLLGVTQYVLLEAGFDTFSCRKPKWTENLRIFEVEHPELLAEKRRMMLAGGLQLPKETYTIRADARSEAWSHELLHCDAYDSERCTFVNLMGLCWDLSKPDFERVLRQVHAVTGSGSSIVLDYMDERCDTMSQSYSYGQIERLLSECGYRIYEHLNAEEMETQYFTEYNLAHPGYGIRMNPYMNFCLAVKK